MFDLSLIALFFTGLLAGFINVMAGGGSALTLPLLIFMGLDGATANGTNRLAILIQNMFAVWNFKREHYSAFKQSTFFALATLPGALVGAVVAVQITDYWFKKILAVVIIFVIISLVLPRPVQGKKKETKYTLTALYLALFGIGFYGGFVQAGVGFILMATLVHLAHLDLVRVNMHKVFIVLIYTVPALAIFAWSGKIDWLLGLSLAAGNGLGGWLAVRLAVHKGEKIIKIVLLFAFAIMAVKLFLL